jgi:hypothetical protein
MTIHRLLLAGWLLAAACCPAARAQGMPEHVQKALNRFVGKWKSVEVVNGNATTSDFEVEWSADKAALNYRYKGPNLVNRAAITAFGTLGWDGSAKVVHERSFATDGSTFSATHQIGNDPNTWESPADGTFAQGLGFTRYINTRVITWNSDDEWVILAKNRQIDGKPQPDSTATWKRAKSAAAQHFDFWKPLTGNWKTRTESGGKSFDGTYSSQAGSSNLCYVTSGSGGPEGASNSVDGYDPLLRTWKASGYSAAGDSWTLLVHVTNLDQLKTLQAGAKGTYQTYRALASGTTETETGSWVFPSWDDKERILKITNTIKNGQPQPDVTIRYERQ